MRYVKCLFMYFLQNLLHTNLINLVLKLTIFKKFNLTMLGGLYGLNLK